MKIRIYPADPAEAVREVTYEGYRPLTLQECRDSIGGGYVETVPLGHFPHVDGGRMTMLVDEDGLMKQLPRNVRATAIAGREIVGDAAIVLTKVPELVGLPDEFTLLAVRVTN